MRYNQKLTTQTLSSTIRACKKESGLDTLYILISGIHTVVDHQPQKGCDSCRNRLKKIIKPSSSSCAEDLVQTADAMCAQVEKDLDSGSRIAMVPPLPANIADSDYHVDHRKLHNAALDQKLCADTATISAVEEYYNNFCKVWTETACGRIRPWGKINNLQNYGRNTKTNVIRTTEKITPFTDAVKKWTYTLTNFIRRVLDSPTSDQENVESETKKEDENRSKKEDESKSKKEVESKKDKKKYNKTSSDEKFEEVVIIGNTEFTSQLQELTKDLKVVHVNENIDFDEEGISVIKKLQKKHTTKTLWIVLSGVSEVAEAIEEGPPKCRILNCKNPLLAYVTKNDKLGDPDYKDMSVDEMVEAAVKVAFDFAVLATDKLKDASDLFLAPIMPLRAIWAGHATSHSHDALHRMFKCNPNVPHFMGGSSMMWINSAKALESVWLSRIMEILNPDSVPYMLMKEYMEEKPPIFGYVEDVTLPEVHQVQEKWAKLMSGIIRYYLHGSSDSQELSAGEFDAWSYFMMTYTT